MSIQGVIFDIGGVLSRDVWEHLLYDPPEDKKPLSVSAKYGIPGQEIKEFGERLWYDYDRNDGDPDTLEREYWTRIRDRFPQLAGVQTDELCKMTEDFIHPVHKDGMSHLLKWLTEKKIKVGICSNNTKFWFPRQIKKFDPYGFFLTESIILSCDKCINKSDLRMFEMAVQSLHLEPAECVFVDDRFGNVERAMKCGMTGVFFPTDKQTGAEYLSRLLRQLIS